MPRRNHLGFGVALALLLAASGARAGTIQIDCDRLSEQEQEELRARARLTLGTRVSPDQGHVLLFRCEPHRAWWHWSAEWGRAIVVDERHGLVEGALEALERHFRHGRGPTSHQSSTEPLPLPDPIPPPAAPAAPQAGGLGLSLTMEPQPGGVAVGPGFELGVGSGDFAGVVSESVRWEGQESTLLWDARLGLAWGAPMVAHRRLGAVVGVGVQGLSVVGRDPGAGGDATGLAPIAGLGVRGSLRWSSVALWTGVDLSYRLQPLEVGAPFDLSLPRWFVTVSVGALVLADISEPRSVRERVRRTNDTPIMQRAAVRTRVSAPPAFLEPVCARIQL